ncbi:MAG: MBL fold metallo-hydrolase [Fimbriimonadaceae bacterium]|nr:MBL fold metallo-hydrolase [Fimbriimonadaceae bacterium]QYK57457.1 MAG: MBL fold metallo-hydrolase [Fimbriimonadaceae bacterium]
MARATAVILGSGTSNGVPTPANGLSASFLADPRNHRTRCSLALLGPTGNVLVDCPPELRLQLLREDIHDLEAVLITHTHADHVMGMDDLRSFCLRYQAEIPVYTSPEYQEDIKRLFPYAFQEFPKGIWVPRFGLRDVEATMRLGGMEIETFWVEHGPVPVLGVKVGGFAYLTDVGHIPEEAWEKLQGLDTLVLDAVRYRPHPNHFHFDRAVEVALELRAGATYFTHLCDDYDHGKVEAGLPPAIRLAYDGLRVEIEL